MPLKQGSSKEVIEENTAESIKAGHSPEQAAAIAYKEAGQTDAMDKSMRVVDDNGFFEVKDNPLSKVGVFPYSGRMVRDTQNPDKIYNVYRPAEELSSQDCIDSFKLLPWFDEHVMVGIKKEGRMTAEQKGVQGVIGEDIYFKDNTLFGNIKVFSQNLANLIENGKIELSCGYTCKYEFATGTHNGVQYDAIQRNIRGNHLALVEEGRMGSEVAVLDSMVFTFDAKELFMADKVKDEKTKPDVKTEEVKTEDEKTEEETGMDTGSLEDRLSKIEATLAKLMPLEKVEHGEALDEKTEEEDAMDKKEIPVMDAAEIKKTVMKEIGERDRLASKVSAVVGVFDHSEMDLAGVAKYAVDKLELDCMDGAEVATINGYLAGAAKAMPVVSVMDSKAKTGNDIQSYLKGDK